MTAAPSADRRKQLVITKSLETKSSWFRATATAVAVSACCLCAAPAAFAGSAYDRVLTVGFDPSASAADRSAARSAAGVSARAALAAPGLQHVDVPDGRSLAGAAAALRGDPRVSFVQLPGSYRKFVNDPYFFNQWALHNTGQGFACEVATVPCPADKIVSGTADADIDAPEGWALASSAAERVAIVDTGVAWQHEDLAANVWVNPDEQGATPLVDDDPYTGYGGAVRSYVDDLHGWDFIGDLVDDGGTECEPYDDTHAAPDNDPGDPDGHGTHVAGIAAAVGDNLKGIVGVNPQAKIVPLRAGDECGYFDYAAIEDAFSYAIDHGVRVVNGSFGGSYPSLGMEAIIDANPQVLFVFAAGNDSADHQNDAMYPCDFPAPNIICVAATDENDVLAGYSDYGYESVDLAAPGSAVLSSIPSVSDPSSGGEGDYNFLNGTSMASPHVAGAATRVWGAHPSLDSSQVKTVLLTSVDAKASLGGAVGFGGRLNLKSAMIAAASPPAPGWPVTPVSPTGSSGGGSTPPSDAPPPSDSGLSPIDTAPPELRIVSTRSARIGRDGAVKFSVVCGERCHIRATGSVRLRYRRTVVKRYSSEAGDVKTVRLRLSGDARRQVLAALRAGRRLTMLIKVSVHDDAGNAATRQTFRVKLRR